MRANPLAILAISLLLNATAFAQQPNTRPTLESQLLAEKPASLAKAVRELGDSRRGAILFLQAETTCTLCHNDGSRKNTLGPDLSRFEKKPTDVHLLESILQPSKSIRKGYEGVTIVTGKGLVINGLLVKETPKEITLKDVSRKGQLITIKKDDIEASSKKPVSIMPKGLVNHFASRQQFLDLMRYIFDIAQNGPQRAAELRPPAWMYAARPLPEYEKNIDHAGMIGSLNAASFKRGAAIYNRLCINCHGTKDRQGSLPTSLRFATGKFKNGSDPFRMYQTLTRGFGMMVRQSWMVPQQKYDVIHYVREAYLKKHNPSQYFGTDAMYLAGLPTGTTRGPEPSNILPWEQMDYGRSLAHTYEIGRDGTNFAYKGIAVRLDPGPGGVSKGRSWMVFDHDTLRVAAGWSGKGFIDWNGIMFNGKHNIHPCIVGDVQFANPSGPGWANPETGKFDDPRLVGRDNRKYGPLPRNWAHFKGQYYHGDKSIVSYTVGKTPILEMPGRVETKDNRAVFTRDFQIGPRDRAMILQVAKSENGSLKLADISGDAKSSSAVILTTGAVSAPKKTSSGARFRFDGKSHLRVDAGDKFDMTSSDYTILARIKTRRGGTIFCKTAPTSKWGPDGKSLFISGGRLTFDIGWVGAVRGRQNVADGKTHVVAMTFQHQSGQIKIFVDGKLDATGNLKPKASHKGHVVRIGYTSPNFPSGNNRFRGEMADVAFFGKVLSTVAIQGLAAKNAKLTDAKSHWKITRGMRGSIADLGKRGFHAKVVRGKPNAQSATPANGSLVAGTHGSDAKFEWLLQDGNLRLKIPAGKTPLNFTLWLGRVEKPAAATALVTALEPQISTVNLATLTKGSSARWTGKPTTQAIIGNNPGPFAIDVFTRPTNNPWFARVRFTGLDFYPGGNSAVVCAWDGDVWKVDGLKDPTGKLTWQRIASGMFQPLGILIVDGKIHVGCRDQICILHDLNGDGETDFYENFNNDHQVTEHFHEFAMGLQRDKVGNFYYAKSARHAKTALVPHHGTLLRVSRDGAFTEILAKGFRAANGVCLNPDGTFIVTDQEGHWNPKNRINWVSKGGFYGNMYGYHDVEDASDVAMQQPLCWITNKFDRSPAELLWVKSKKWGPLDGSLLNFSYGYGKVYIVPHEKLNGQMQGGMCAFPIPQFPTGVMRGRFSTADGQLYMCGMFAWAGSQQQPGGFYRLRYTGKPVHLPIGLNATKAGMKITFSGPLDPTVAADPANYKLKTWDLKRTKNYGSKHYNEKPLVVKSVTVSADGKSVLLHIPEIKPTWCMEIRYALRGKTGRVVEGTIHNTVHGLGAASRK